MNFSAALKECLCHFVTRFFYFFVHPSSIFRRRVVLFTGDFVCLSVCLSVLKDFWRLKNRVLWLYSECLCHGARRLFLQWQNLLFFSSNPARAELALLFILIWPPVHPTSATQNSFFTVICWHHYQKNSCLSICLDHNQEFRLNSKPLKSLVRPKVAKSG